MSITSRNSLLTLCAVGLGLFLCWHMGLRINLTPSLPKGFYLLCPGTPGRGDLAAFCLEGDFAELARQRGYLQAGSCPSGLRPLLKRVAGLPGDSIPGNLAVRSVDSLGRAVPSESANGIIPSGMALVLAEHPGSFDSRYFGLVPLENLRRVKAVWVWKCD